MPTYTADNAQQVNRALNILFKQYIGVSATSLNSLISPFGELFATQPSVKGGDRVWLEVPELAPISVDAGNAQVTDKIHYWAPSRTYIAGNIVITPEADCTDEVPNLVYVCTTGNTSTDDANVDTGKPVSATNSWEAISTYFVKDLIYTIGGTGGGESSGGKYFYNSDTSSVGLDGDTRKVASDMIPFTYGSASDSPYDYEFKDGGADLIQGSPTFYVDTHAGTIWLPKGTEEMNYPTGTITLSFFIYRGKRLITAPSALPIPINEGGTGTTTRALAFDALAPDSTLGDMLISNMPTDNSWKVLDGSTNSKKHFLTQTGITSASADPAWGVLTSPDIPGIESGSPTLVVKNTNQEDSSDGVVMLDIDSFNSGTMDATLNLGTHMTSGDTIQVGNASADVYIDGNTITLTGTTTSYLSETVEIADNILVLNSNITTEPAEDAGFEVNRGSDPNTNQGIGRPAILWDESEMNWTANVVNTDDDDTDQSDVFSVTMGVTYKHVTTAQGPGDATSVEVNALPVGGLFVNTADDTVWIKTS